MLSPGEALFVPGFIGPEQAMRLGSFIRPLCEESMRLDMAYFINTPGKHTPGEAPLNDEGRETLQLLQSQVDEALAGPIPKEEYVMATYMNSPIRRFAWHVDPDFDVRPIVNIGDTETTILLSTARGSFAPNSEGIYLDTPPADEDQLTLTLEPGDAYFLDNRLARADRMPHATPLGAMGRLMLRFNRIYPSWEDQPFDLSQFEGTTSIGQLETTS